MLTAMSGCAFVIRTGPASTLGLTPNPAVSFGLKQLGLTTLPHVGLYDSYSADYCNAVATDAAGNIYCGGLTSGALAETNGGTFDAFVAKFNSGGDLQWIKQLGAVSAPAGASAGEERCTGITTDADGNVYCGGTTSGALGEASGGNNDVFVAKFNSSGDLQWIRQLGAVSAPAGASSGNDSCNGIATDALGNIYCGGTTSGSLGEANGGGFDGFIVKIDPDGSLLWVRQLGSVSAPAGASGSTDVCLGITADTAGHIYCGGYTFGYLGQPSGGSADAFVAQYNTSGALLWVNQIGATAPLTGDASGADYCASITTDPSGNVFCGGHTSGSLDDGGNGGNSDAFVSKVNSAGALQWVKQLGATAAPAGASSGDDFCKGITSDAAGEIYCGGTTSGNLGEASGGNSDAFVARFNSAGVLQWIKQFGGISAPSGASSEADACNGIVTDASGNIFCGGETSGALGEANGGGSESDVFISKLDSAGAIDWSKQIGAVSAPAAPTAGFDSCLGVTTDSSGNIYCAGQTSGALGEANGGGYDAFVAKFNSEGTLQWLKQLGAVSAPAGASSGSDACAGVTTDSNGNVYCGGYTNGSLAETNGGDNDAFVAKYNSAGTLQWVKQLGAVLAPAGASSSRDYCYGVAADASGNVYCGGYTNGDLGEVSGGSKDVFITKFDTNGTFQWVKQLGAVSAPAGASSDEDLCNAITTDSRGNVYCGGHTLGSLGEASGGDADVIIAKFNSAGSVQWVKQLGAVSAPAGASSGTDYCYGITSDVDGNIYCGGSTSGAFGEANGGGDDALAVKLNSAGDLQWVRQLGAVSAPSGASSEEDTCTGITTDSSGNIYCGGYTGGSLGEANGAGGNGISNDAFIAKFTSLGNLQWVSQLGAVSAPDGASSGDDRCKAITTDSLGNTFCAGYTDSSLAETIGGTADAFVWGVDAGT